MKDARNQGIECKHGKLARSCRECEIEDRIQTIADEAFGPFPQQEIDTNMDEIERGIFEYKRAVAVALAALERLRDCDWVISLPDRMDAVRDIAKDAIAAIHSSNTRADRTRHLVTGTVRHLVGSLN